MRNFHVAVREWNEEIIFLHKIMPGAADKSYGIQVARLAGLPKPVVERAKSILSHLELHSVKPEAKKQEPAVSIRSSIKPDFIVCLEDGKKLKMLKRHLMTHYQMTPDQYRAKWNLPADYPMVAPNYAEQRRTLAKKIGLGTKRRKTARG